MLSYVALRHRGPIALPRDCSENVASLQLRHSLKDFSSVRRTVTDMRSRLNENTVEAVELPSLGSACSFFYVLWNVRIWSGPIPQISGSGRVTVYPGPVGWCQTIWTNVQL